MQCYLMKQRVRGMEKFKNYILIIPILGIVAVGVIFIAANSASNENTGSQIQGVLVIDDEIDEH